MASTPSRTLGAKCVESGFGQVPASRSAKQAQLGAQVIQDAGQEKRTARRFARGRGAARERRSRFESFGASRDDGPELLVRGVKWTTRPRGFGRAPRLAARPRTHGAISAHGHADRRVRGKESPPTRQPEQPEHAFRWTLAGGSDTSSIHRAPQDGVRCKCTILGPLSHLQAGAT
jgi:hypothetical protein